MEDELQDEVADCISDFRGAEIKVWVVTGDLGHTALEIAYNCGVMSRSTESSEVFRLETTDLMQLSNEVGTTLSNIL